MQLDPEDGAWLLDTAPLMPPVQYATHEEWEARIGQAARPSERG